MAKSRSKPFQFDPAMRVALLKGPEPYLQAQYLRLIAEGIEASLGEMPCRFDFDGPQASLAAVLDELRSYGLMQSHKLVVLDAAEQFVKKEANRRALETYAATPMDEATLVLRTLGDWRAPKLEKAIESRLGIWADDL